MRLFYFILGVLFSSVAFAAEPLPWVAHRVQQNAPSRCWILCYGSPAPSDVLSQIGEAVQQALFPHQIRVLIWNIYKANREGWDRDFRRMSYNQDLVLLQETKLNDQMSEAFQEHHQHGWTHATSFYVEDEVPTGLATGSKAAARRMGYLRSRDREPVVDTPKLSLFTYYDLEGFNQSLLVINIHAINFNWRIHAALKRQILDIEKIIQLHKGPVLFAGDFNTWSAGRMKLVLDILGRNGLYPVSFPEDPRRAQLDHVFVRGLVPKKAEILSWIESSDHFPIAAEFSLNSL